MNYPSSSEIQQLKTRLSKLLGYQSEEAWVANLAYELEWEPKNISDADLIHRYTVIVTFSLTLK